MRGWALLWPLWLLVGPCAADPLSPDLVSLVVAKHTEYRGKYSGCALKWTPALEQQAAGMFLESCRPRSLTRDVGLNVGAVETSDTRGVLTVVDHWFSENKAYTPSDPAAARNFTQMVWRSTTHVGCAMCQHGPSLSLLCLYLPPGNAPNGFQDNVLPGSPSCSPPPPSPAPPVPTPSIGCGQYSHVSSCLAAGGCYWNAQCMPLGSSDCHLLEEASCNPPCRWNRTQRACLQVPPVECKEYVEQLVCATHNECSWSVDRCTERKEPTWPSNDCATFSSRTACLAIVNCLWVASECIPITAAECSALPKAECVLQGERCRWKDGRCYTDDRPASPSPRRDTDCFAMPKDDCLLPKCSWGTEGCREPECTELGEQHCSGKCRWDDAVKGCQARNSSACPEMTEQMCEVSSLCYVDRGVCEPFHSGGCRKLTGEVKCRTMRCNWNGTGCTDCCTEETALCQACQHSVSVDEVCSRHRDLAGCSLRCKGGGEPALCESISGCQWKGHTCSDEPFDCVSPLASGEEEWCCRNKACRPTLDPQCNCTTTHAGCVACRLQEEMRDMCHALPTTDGCSEVLCGKPCNCVRNAHGGYSCSDDPIGQPCEQGRCDVWVGCTAPCGPTYPLSARTCCMEGEVCVPFSHVNASSPVSMQLSRCRRRDTFNPCLAMWCPPQQTCAVVKGRPTCRDTQCRVSCRAGLGCVEVDGAATCLAREQEYDLCRGLRCSAGEVCRVEAVLTSRGYYSPNVSCAAPSASSSPIPWPPPSVVFCVADTDCQQGEVCTGCTPSACRTAPDGAMECEADCRRVCQVPPYDCSPNGSQGGAEKQRYCCLHFGVGCPVYDCSVGCVGSWSAEKRGWCCQSVKKGCEVPDTSECTVCSTRGCSAADCGSPETPEAAEVCCRTVGVCTPCDDFGVRWWPTAKRVRCCSREGLGCSPPLSECPGTCPQLLPTPPPPCQSLSPSPTSRTQCCKDFGLLCPLQDNTPPTPTPGYTKFTVSFHGSWEAVRSAPKAFTTLLATTLLLPVSDEASVVISRLCPLLPNGSFPLPGTAWWDHDCFIPDPAWASAAIPPSSPLTVSNGTNLPTPLHPEGIGVVYAVHSPSSALESDTTAMANALEEAREGKGVFATDNEGASLLLVPYEIDKDTSPAPESGASSVVLWVIVSLITVFNVALCVVGRRKLRQQKRRFSFDAVDEKDLDMDMLQPSPTYSEGHLNDYAPHRS